MVGFGNSTKTDLEAALSMQQNESDGSFTVNGGVKRQRKRRKKEEKKWQSWLLGKATLCLGVFKGCFGRDGVEGGGYCAADGGLEMWRR